MYWKPFSVCVLGARTRRKGEPFHGWGVGGQSSQTAVFQEAVRVLVPSWPFRSLWRSVFFTNLLA